MIRMLFTIVLLTGVYTAASAGDRYIANLRGEVPVPDEADAPVSPPIENKDIKRERAYPMQAPTIPHKIDNYQLDLYANKCMSCHSRRRVEESQAPMVSVTHYMDRDGNFLAEISPRRYFCNQCHIPQHVVDPQIGNMFEDMETIVERQSKD